MKRSTIWMIASGGLIMLGCGGAQKVDEGLLATCNSEAAAIEEQGKVCDPDEIERFEIRVKGWQEKCRDMAAADVFAMRGKQLDESLGCAEETRALRARQAQCKGRVETLVIIKGCGDRTCEEFLKDLNALIAECEPLGEKETDVNRVKELVRNVEALKAEQDLEAALKQLSTECNEARRLHDDGSAEDALTKLMIAVANTPLSKATISESEMVDAAESEAFEACRDVLKKTIDVHVQQVGKSLKNRRVKKDPELWMSHFRKLEGMSGRLREVGAESIYPEATDAIDKLLLKFDKTKNEMDSKIIASNKKKAKAQEKAGDEGAAGAAEESAKAEEGEKAEEPATKGPTPKILTTGQKRCAKVTTVLKRVRAKIKEYENKGNEAKVRAYTNKLKKEEAALEELIKEVSEALLGVSPEQAEKARKEFASVGCPLE